MSDLQREIEQQYASDQGRSFYKTVMGDGGFDIHYGLYTDSTTSMRDATKAATQRMMHLVEGTLSADAIRSVADLGSGRGGPAHLLAVAFDADVTCIDLCRPHHQENLSRASELGLRDRIRTWLGSYESMPATWSDAFDLAWAQETFCHAGEIDRALAEAVRIVRPRGVIAFSDIMLSDSATPSQAQAFLSVNAVTGLSTANRYHRRLREIGVQDPLYEDWSEHLEFNFLKMLGQIESHRAGLMDRGVSADYLDRFAASLRSRIEFAQQRVLRWGVFVARVP